MDPEGDQPAETEDFTDAGRFLKLAEDDGIATWLDLETGAFVYRAADPPAEPANLDLAAGGGSHMSDDDEQVHLGLMLADVRAMFDSHGYQYEHLDSRWCRLTMHGAKGFYRVWFSADDNTGFVRVFGSYGAAIPPERRSAIADTASRVNFTLVLGNFELDFSDGELRFRVSMDIEGGLFAKQVADNMLGCLMHTMDRYADTFMRVAFGDVEPEEALRDAA